MESDISDEYCESPKETENPRKRKFRPENWKKNIVKQNKLAKKASVRPQISCEHDSGFCSAASLLPIEIQDFHDSFYENKGSISQKKFISAYIDVISPERRRPNQGSGKDIKKTMSVKYKVKSQTGVVNVCRDTFLSVLNIGRRMVENVAKAKQETGIIGPEKRGGSRLTAEMVRLQEEISSHIKSFKCREKHYGRDGAPGRKYLPVDLNVRKMWILFCEQHGTSGVSPYCTYTLYYKIFVTKFNLGFGSMKQDTCSDCLKYSIQFKSAASTEEKKEIVLQRMVHKYRAKAFFQNLNQLPDNSLTINFDLMQNQPLPKTTIGQAYYSRQLWYYIFGIVIVEKDKTINENTTHFYRWLENEGGRGPNEISSCLWDFFLKILFPLCKKKHIDTLRVFCDSCSSQNKNYCNLFMLSVIAHQFNLQVEWFFPIRGHSYMPADRAFGLVEKRIRKKSCILLPEEYDILCKDIGKLHVLGVDFNWVNWQNLSKVCMPSSKSIKISEAKRITLKAQTGLVGLHPFYAEAPQCQHTILKKSVKYEHIMARIRKLNAKSHVQPAKKSDVIKLLGDMGYSVGDLPFYNRALNEYNSNKSSNDVSDNEVINEDNL